MSLVLAVASLNEVIIKSDGREMKPDTHKIVNEDFKKIIASKNNPKILFGFTGTAGLCKALITD